MANIIQFPTNRIQNTNGYKNLVALFEICDTLESCNFYLDTVEELYTKGSITEKELYTLRRIGRTKRLELAAPAKQEPEKAEAPGTYCYTPEMGQQKPDCQMEAQHSYYGGHYYIDTPIELKGRGITPVEAHWIDGCKKQIENWKCYRVTKNAFEKLKEQYTISMECCLD